MAHKKKSKFQILTIVMVILMAVVTLAAIILPVLIH
ncbi:MAG: DUF4044 domain-containing protein [Lactobacillus sp.]